MAHWASGSPTATLTHASTPNSQVVTALGRAWHPEHFVCGGCSTALGGSSFFEKDGAPFCPECYFERFSPRCGLCNQPIRHVSPAWTTSPASVSPEELHPLRHFPSPSQPLPAFSSSSLRTSALFDSQVPAWVSRSFKSSFKPLIYWFRVEGERKWAGRHAECSLSFPAEDGYCLGHPLAPGAFLLR